MAIEGIFRKNGNIRKLQLIAEQLDKDYSSVNLSDENPVQLAALLKRFLREIPDPLLTFRLHKLFCSAATLPSHEERIRSLHLLITLLPKANRDTLEVLFVFLRWVASFSYKDEETGSRMDMANLATVITPSILYAKGGNAARDESFIGIQAVQQMLDNQDELYRVPPELMFVLHENVAEIFSKEIDLPPKEIHKHCAKYLQHRGGTTFQHRPSIAAGAGLRECGRSMCRATLLTGQMAIFLPQASAAPYELALRPATAHDLHHGVPGPAMLVLAAFLPCPRRRSTANLPARALPHLGTPQAPDRHPTGVDPSRARPATARDNRRGDLALHRLVCRPTTAVRSRWSATALENGLGRRPTTPRADNKRGHGPPFLILVSLARPLLTPCIFPTYPSSTAPLPTSVHTSRPTLVQCPRTLG